MSDFNPDRRPDPRVRVTPTQARQGLQGRRGLYILIAGLALVLLAWGAMELYPRGSSRTASGAGPTERVAPADPQSTGSLPAAPTPAPRAPSGQPPAPSEGAR